MSRKVFSTPPSNLYATCHCEGVSPKQSRLTCKQLFECKHWIASSLGNAPRNDNMDRKELILRTIGWLSHFNMS
jgi:hypothetical protein